MVQALELLYALGGEKLELSSALSDAKRLCVCPQVWTTTAV